MISYLKSAVAAMATSMVLAAGAVNAATLVDTGAPPGGGTDWTLGNSGSGGQSLAGKFTLAEKSVIQSIAIFGKTSTAGTLNYGIASVASGLPGTNLFLQSQSLSTTGISPVWQETSGMNWVLDAGTYYVTFEAQVGYVGSARSNVPSPLAMYAFENLAFPGWRTQALNFGVRINGEAYKEPMGEVPLPAGLPLLAVGIGGLWILRRRGA